MSRLLAPSNLGFVSRSYSTPTLWNTVPFEPKIKVTASGTVLCSFKGPTVLADRRAPTNYVRMIGKIIPGGAWRAQNSQYTVKGEAGLPAGLYVLPNGCQYSNGVVTVPTWMRDRVIADARIELDQITANILEDLGQLRSTGVMVLDIFTTICTLYRDARKGLWWKIRRALRQKGINIPRHVANGWLMYFYGIKPLIGTIDALCQSEKPKYKVMKVRKRISQDVDPWMYQTASKTQAGVTVSGRASVQAQCQLAASIKLAGNLAYWQNLGLTHSSLTDLVVTGWALVPYSFVVDWILPVETFLRTRVWAPFLEYQGGFVGSRHEVDATIVDSRPWSGSGYTGTFPTCKLQCKFYKRETYPYYVPSSGLSIRLSLSPTQIASAVALAIK